MSAVPPSTSDVNGITFGVEGSGLPICTCVGSLLTAEIEQLPVMSAPDWSRTWTAALFGPSGTTMFISLPLGLIGTDSLVSFPWEHFAPQELKVSQCCRALPLLSSVR